MAAQLFDKYVNALLTNGGNIPDVSTATMKVAFLASGTQAVDASSTGDEYLSDISANVLTTSDPLNVTVSNRAVDAADGVTLTDPGGGDTADQAVLYADTGTASTSRLVLLDDTVSITFDGTDDTLNIDASGLFDL